MSPLEGEIYFSCLQAWSNSREAGHPWPSGINHITVCSWLCIFLESYPLWASVSALVKWVVVRIKMKSIENVWQMSLHGLHGKCKHLLKRWTGLITWWIRTLGWQRSRQSLHKFLILPLKDSCISSTENKVLTLSRTWSRGCLIMCQGQRQVCGLISRMWGQPRGV